MIGDEKALQGAAAGTASKAAEVDGTGGRVDGADQTSCGYVALIGLANVGKSTLFNALLGESLSIVTPKAQTTQRRITGIRTEGSRQFVFLDAPGVLRPKYNLQRALLVAARRAAREADVIVLLMDPTGGGASDDQRRALLELLDTSGGHRIGVLTKVDVADPAAVAREREWLGKEAGTRPMEVSALKGEGVDALREAIGRALPEGPFLFSEEDLAVDPVRFFVAERVREVLFERFRDEIPYASFCAVEELREGTEPVYISAVIYVERASQKGILIGAGGQAIRGVGVAARQRIEHFLGSPVYLDLRVKVLPGWRRKRSELRRLGFPVPEDDEQAGR